MHLRPSQTNPAHRPAPPQTRCGCEATGSNRLLASLRAAAAQQTKQEQQHDLSDMRAARFDALRPGGELARRFLARHPTVLQVGSTLFVHGGVLPHHVEYGLERINRETQVGVGGRGPGPSRVYRESLVWSGGQDLKARGVEAC